MNLTCGRNPWKRASIEDSTFRAYLKNPKFLSSILPLSSELDVILRRIFECDPRKRIGIPELRNLILRCSRFTSRPNMGPPTPLSDVQYVEEMPYGNAPNAINPFQQYPLAPYSPTPSPPIHPVAAQYSQFTISSNGSSSSDDGSVFSSSSSCSTTSSNGSQGEASKVPIPTFIPPQPVGNFYGNFFPMEPVLKDMVPPPFVPLLQVC